METVRRVRRDGALLGAAALLLAVGMAGLVEAWSWVGKPFPGFLVLENRVVASAGLAHWPATADGALYQHEVVAVDGAPLRDRRELRARVRSLAPGTKVTYRFRSGAREVERTIPTRRFEPADFWLLFGTYLLNGAVLGGTGLVLLALRRRYPGGRAAVPLLLVGAVWGLTAMDLYGPYHLFRLHALCEALLCGAALHMALGFPHPAPLARRHPWLVWVPYAFSAGLASVYQVGLREPASYVSAHLLATSALGAALLVLLSSQLLRYARAASLERRRQIGALAAGAALALALPVVLTAAEALTGGRMPQNAVGFTAFIFPLAIARAALREAQGRWQAG